MKRIRRGGALLLAIFLLLGLLPAGAGAVSFADADQIKHPDAVSLVTELGIMTGTGEGGAFFNPQGTIARGEMCRILCLCLNGGKDPQLDLAEGYRLSFSDITEEGNGLYVEYCYNLGLVSGRGDGTFDPEGSVTGTQAVKMLLVAIGYDAKVEGFTGPGWAISANVRGNQKNFYQDLELDPSAPITRDDAAQLIYNAIHAVMVKYDYALTSVNGELQAIPVQKDVEDGRTILSRCFGIKTDQKTN